MVYIEPSLILHHIVITVYHEWWCVLTIVLTILRSSSSYTAVRSDFNRFVQWLRRCTTYMES